MQAPHSCVPPLILLVLAVALLGCGEEERSAFFDVVAHELGLPDHAVHAPIDPGLVRRLA